MKKLTNDTEYRQLMTRIESYLQKATTLGGFTSLSADEASELASLSLLAEEYEDSLPLMPIQVPQGIPRND